MIPTIYGHDCHHENCFGCGKKNLIGLKADFTFNPTNGEVLFEYSTNESQEGAPEHVHGGILASLLDEAQGSLCYHLGHFVMTDQLSIKYNKAVPLLKSLTIRAWITAVRKRRLYTKSVIMIDGMEHVSSKARWYLMSERTILRLFEKTNRFNIHDLLNLLEENRKRAKKIRKKLKQAN